MVAISLALSNACGDGTGPSGAKPSGEYAITTTGERIPGPPRFRVVSADDDRVILDWLGGDHRQAAAFPVRDTAASNVEAYRVQWLGAHSGVNYILRFTAGICSGITALGTGGGLDSRPWRTCRIGRP